MTPNRIRKQLHAERQSLKKIIKQKPISELVAQYTTAIDKLLLQAWQQCRLDSFDELCLIAVGGYGRAELQPYSDIDILILSHEQFSEKSQMAIERFIQFLWDADLEISHSVWTLSECLHAAREDITIISTLMEARYLVGDEQVYKQLNAEIAPANMWPEKTFFQAKWEEQQRRYTKYDNTAYNLEPNVKFGPGGLRDIHMIAWVAKRHFAAHTLHDLVDHHFLTEDEYRVLIAGQQFLWLVTYHLHLLCDRRQSQLLFDHQPALAKAFGYEDSPNKLAIEKFMMDYYRAIKSLRELNDMLLQLFREAIIGEGKTEIEVINERFQIINHYIEARHENVFSADPAALLEIFVLMAANTSIQGVRASTIRLIRQHRYLIDNEFRQQHKHQQLFLTLLRTSPNLDQQFQRMNRYGVLEKYLPAFGLIIGQMQYDLFHSYTVDQHIIFLIRNIRRFRLSEYRGEFPLCADIIETITKPEILYLAAIFHDIAKGQGGDHSELGGQQTRAFCLLHNIPPEDSEIAVWLVENHLLMSSTAQREDIHDYETLQRFASKMQDQVHLDYLYLLTVADICATNPNIWNSWKDTLLKELYTASKTLLSQQQKAVNHDVIIAEKQQRAEKLLSKQGIDIQQVKKLWQQLSPHYFMRETPANIAWHTHGILEHPHSEQPLVLIKQHELKGGTEIFVYTPIIDKPFVISTTVMANQSLNILEARLASTKHGYSLATYIVLDEANKPITQDHRLNFIQKNLLRYHEPNSHLPHLINRRVPRSIRHFNAMAKVKFSHDEQRDRTILRLTAPDRPGLLALVGRVFLTAGIRLSTAKINTLGDQVEDVFFITNPDNHAITNESELKSLEQQLKQAIQA